MWTMVVMIITNIYQKMKNILLWIKTIVFVDKPNWIGSKILPFLLENPTLFITLLYILFSGLGLLFEVMLFSQFKVNVLDYSEASDFFLSAFKRPRALLLALIIAMTFIVQRYIANFSRKRKSLFVKILLWPFCWAGFFRREILVPFGIIYFLFFFINSAKNEAIRLVFENDSFAIVSTRFGESKSSSLIPIGTTERFLFGIQNTAELKKSRESYNSNNDFIFRKSHISKPIIQAISFSNITSIQYSIIEITDDYFIEPTF